MSESADSERRRGDVIAIPGDYQHRALLSGPPIQRHWHLAKLRLLEWFFVPQTGERILEVGCGSGVFADAMAKRGALVTCVDANADAVAYATATFARPGLEVRRGYLDELALPEASYDAATALEIIEHVYLDQVRKLLADLRRILKPGGRLLLTTPNYRGVWPILEWAADRFSKAAKMDQEQHVLHFRRALLRDVLVEAGFVVESLRTYCTIAPFAAAISTKFADWCERRERRIDLPFGCLLAAVARRPDA
jgi:2-polyprenyl-3-methyl-5-hydroxy-6-metoxy-1,4-benzoquinol methylase